MKSVELEAITDELLEALAGAASNEDAVFVEPSSVFPASVLVELSGESVRGRLCSFTAPDGEEYCMRPDMTAPLAMDIAKGELEAGRFIYSGPVYRFPQSGSGDTIEFDQTGFEWFSESENLEEDAEGLALTLELLMSFDFEVGDLELCFGDGALFSALIDALNLPEPWPRRLRKAFNRRRGPRELIEASEKSVQRSPLAAALSSLNAEDATAAVEEVFNVSGISPVGGRDAAEIASRLRSLSTQSATPLDDLAKRAILDLLDVKTSARQAVEVIFNIAKEAGINLDAALERYALRLDCLEKLGVPTSLNTLFNAEFGRRFDYYDGIVFKITHSHLGSSLPVATGGRYDGLVRNLSSGRVSANGFGVALRPDRILNVLTSGEGQ